MRTWSRALSGMLCGRCMRVIVAGEPVQVIALEGVKHQKRRCVGCAEGDPPPDLPAVVRAHRTTKPMQPIRALAFDWKAAAAHGR